MKWLEIITGLGIFVVALAGFVLFCHGICQKTASRQAAVQRMELSAPYVNEFANMQEVDR
jgi:hypothetical protein